MAQESKADGRHGGEDDSDGQHEDELGHRRGECAASRDRGVPGPQSDSHR